jgi:hypothetical protein
VVSETETETETDNNPWCVRGLIRYEEKDLAYADRKMLEAVKMNDPEEQRRHLQDVIELFATKYFVELTVEDLLEDADLDIVRVHRMLVEAVDDPGPGIDCRAAIAEIFKEYIDDDV